MRASTLSFCAAVTFVVLGMAWGIQMAMSHDHTALPAHAHLNLLGWVSLFLFGLYYRLHPAVDTTRTAVAQVWVWIAGTAVMTVGIGLVRAGNGGGEPLAAIGSIVVLADMLFFGGLLFRGERAAAARASVTRAE
jgi:hypothetical protein